MAHETAEEVRSISWAKISAFVLTILAGGYAAQHPHTLIYHVVKFILLPVP